MRLSIIILFAIFLTSNAVFGQSKDKVYSVFIFNFAKYIQWPADRTTGEFVIGILGNAAMVEELKNAISTKTIGNQKVFVKDCQVLQETSGCHVVFVAENKSQFVRDIIKKLSSESTLLITEKSGLAKNGGGISFMLADGKMNFEINKESIERKGMKIASTLSNLGTVVGD
jgi:hypothetical protein